jgi:hypothetical protein
LPDKGNINACIIVYLHHILWRKPMVGLAAAMFVAVYAFGHEMIGWSDDANSQVQLALFLSFILGIVCGYKTKG